MRAPGFVSSPEGHVRGRTKMGMVRDSREFVGNAMMAASLDGTIQFCNDASQQLFGYSAPELMGLPLHHLVAPEHRPKQQHLLSGVRTADHGNGHPMQLIRRDGTRFDASMSVSPYRDASGAVVGTFTIVAP